MYSVVQFAKGGTRPFTLEELREFFATFDINRRKEKRTRLYFLIQFYLGLRKNSVDKFNIKNLNWKRRIYRVIDDKGKDRYSNNGIRYIPIPQELFYHLQQHWEGDCLDIRAHDGYFFYTEDKNIPSPTYYQKLFRKHIERAELNQAYTAYDINMEGKRQKGWRHLHTLVTHSFRKSYAAWLLESGCDLGTLMELLGHTSMLATHKYMRLAMNKRIDIVNKAFDGKIERRQPKPLVLLEDTPVIQDENSLVNVQLTKDQVKLLNRLGVLEQTPTHHMQ